MNKLPGTNILTIFFIMVLSIAYPCYGQLEFTRHPVNINFNNPREVYAIELNGDPYIDILTAGDGENYLHWHENNGDQTFTAHQLVGDYRGAMGVYALDLDHDGDNDIVSCTNLGPIIWWQNNGEGVFELIPVTLYDCMANRIHLADLDGDGDYDIAASSEERHIVFWYENNGNQNFTEHIIRANYPESHDVFIVDLDLDGDNDILSVAMVGNLLTWWENDNTNFIEHTIDDDFDGACAVTAIDLDQDKDIDVLATGYIEDEVGWWENDGTQHFTYHPIGTQYDWAISVQPADMDMDGDIDVISSAFADDEVTCWINDGMQNFEELNIEAGYDGAVLIHVFDMDGDGDNDVIGSAMWGDRVDWWENGITELIPTNVSGIVIDSYDTLPIENALVNIGGNTTLTDQEGYFEFNQIFPGRYHAEISAEHYNSLIIENLDLITGNNHFVFELDADFRYHPVPPSELPYEILITEAYYYGELLLAGDEIGIFDGDLCVGSGYVTGAWPLSIITWQRNINEDHPGFTPGNPIDYLVFSHIDGIEYSPLPIYLYGNGTFGEGESSEVILQSPVYEHFPVVLPSGVNYNIIVRGAYLNDLPLDNGDEIAAFDGNQCVGAVTVDNNWPLSVVCWQNNPERNRPGFENGNIIVYRIWSCRNNQEYESGVFYLNGEDGTFGCGNQSEVVLNARYTDVAEADLPLSFTVESAYPNPFNATTRIQYSIPEKSQISFRIFNILGQQVYGSTSIQEPGCHSFIFDFEQDNHVFNTGIYFLEVNYKGQSITQKLLLFK